MKEDQTSLVHLIENQKLVSREDSGSRCDIHVHSKYSGVEPTRYVGSPVTKLIGVKESYSSPKRLLKRLRKRGMDFFTISDHDSILGALELRRLCPDRSFVSCEYTVTVNPVRGQYIHVGCYGLDYTGGGREPLPDSTLKWLHDELKYLATRGYERFTEFCRYIGLPYALNHPPWQAVPKQPLSGRQLDEIIEEFPVLEINSDHQLENLMTAYIAIAKGKALCAGTDAHSIRRLGRQYTSTLEKVDTPFGFVEAFCRRKMAIGSRDMVPQHVEDPGVEDIIRHRFNGSVCELRKDIYRGIFDYIMYDWGARKLATSGLAYLLKIGLVLGLGVEAAVPVLAGVGGFALAAIPFGMARIERSTVAKRTGMLYKDYRRHFIRNGGDPSLMPEDMPNILRDPKIWDRMAYMMLNPVNYFHTDYGMELMRHDTDDSRRQDSDSHIL